MMDFEEFFTQYKGLIWAQLHRWNLKPADKEDAFQEASLKIFKYYESMWANEQEHGNMEAWLTACIKRQVKFSTHAFLGFAHHENAGMAKTYKQTMIDKCYPTGLMTGESASEGDEPDGELPVAFLEWAPSAEDKYILSTENDYVWSLVDKLPEIQRDCIVLRYYNDLEPKEIAAKVGKTPRQVATALYNAKETLRLHVDAHSRGEVFTYKKPLSECCINDHEFTVENTIVRPEGHGRGCRECAKIGKRKSRAKKKAEAAKV